MRASHCAATSGASDLQQRVRRGDAVSGAPSTESTGRSAPVCVGGARRARVCVALPPTPCPPPRHPRRGQRRRLSPRARAQSHGRRGSGRARGTTGWLLTRGLERGTTVSKRGSDARSEAHGAERRTRRGRGHVGGPWCEARCRDVPHAQPPQHEPSFVRRSGRPLAARAVGWACVLWRREAVRVGVKVGVRVTLRLGWG